MRFAKLGIRILLPVMLSTLMVLWLLGVFRRGTIQGEKIEQPAQSVNEVPFISVNLTRAPFNTEAVGIIQAGCRIEISSRVSAHIVAIPVRAGRRVRKGDILVRCDERDLKSRLMQAMEALRRAEAERDLAANDHRRNEGLSGSGAISRSEIDKTDARLKTTSAEVDRAREVVREAEVTLGYAEIRSPVDGTVIDRFAEAGDLAISGKILLTLYDRALRFEADVRENDAARLRMGDAYTVLIDAVGERMSGPLVEIVPSADPASRTVAARIALHDDNGLYPGMFGRLLIPAGEAEYLLIPCAALIYVGQLAMVDVLSDGSLKRRAVQPGRKRGESVEILSGLVPGERVALRQPDGIRP